MTVDFILFYFVCAHIPWSSSRNVKLWECLKGNKRFTDLLIAFPVYRLVCHPQVYPTPDGGTIHVGSRLLPYMACGFVVSLNRPPPRVTSHHVNHVNTTRLRRDGLAGKAARFSCSLANVCKTLRSHSSNVTVDLFTLSQSVSY